MDRGQREEVIPVEARPWAPWLPWVLFGCVIGGDLALRRGSFAGAPAVRAAVYLASVAFEGLCFWSALRALARLSRRRRGLALGLLGGLCAAYGFAILGSWAFYLYFDTLPGVFAFSYLLQEPADFLSLLGDGFTWGAVLGLGVFAAASFAALAPALRPPSALPLRRRAALVAAFLVLTLVLHNNVKIRSGYALPATDALFSFKVALSRTGQGRARHARLQKRLVAGPPAALGRAAAVNGLLIVNESLRRQSVSAFGYGRRTTPEVEAFLDRHAAEVADFPDAFANATATDVAVPALFTGQNTVGGLEPLERSYTLYEQVKRLAKVRTALISSHSYQVANYREFFASPALDLYWYREVAGLPKFCNAGADDAYAVARLVEFLGSLQAGEKFFAILHLNGTHYPYTVPAGFQVFPGGRTLDDYDNAVAYLDHNLGAVFRALEARGLDESTWVWLTSDHGENVETVGEMGHFGPFTRATTNIPFALVAPRSLLSEAQASALATNRNRVVGNQDVYPTVLDLYGVPYDEAAYPGRSLLRPLPADRAFFVFNGARPGPRANYLGVLWRGTYWLLSEGKGRNAQATLSPLDKSAPAADLWPRLAPAERESYLRLLDGAPALQPFARALRGARQP